MAHQRLHAEYVEWQLSVHPDPDQAHPDPDVRDRAALTAGGYQWVGALTRMAVDRTYGRETEGLGMDSDVLLAQMMQAAALPL